MKERPEDHLNNALPHRASKVYHQVFLHKVLRPVKVCPEDLHQAVATDKTDPLPEDPHQEAFLKDRAVLPLLETMPNDPLNPNPHFPPNSNLIPQTCLPWLQNWLVVTVVKLIPMQILDLKKLKNHLDSKKKLGKDYYYLLDGAAH